MINFDDVIKDKTNKRNPNWPKIPNPPYRILTIEGPGSGKTNYLI